MVKVVIKDTTNRVVVEVEDISGEEAAKQAVVAMEKLEAYLFPDQFPDQTYLFKTCPRCGSHHYFHKVDCPIGKYIRDFENEIAKLPDEAFEYDG